MADDHKLYVRGIGDIIVQAKVNNTIRSLKLKDVLYVPKLRRNLISTSQLTEKRVAILHVRDTCKMISDDGLGCLIMTTHKYEGLWRMDIHIDAVQSSTNVASSSVDAHATNNQSYRNLEKWYNHLGHVNIHTLKQMAWDDVAIRLPS